MSTFGILLVGLVAGVLLVLLTVLVVTFYTSLRSRKSRPLYNPQSSVNFPRRKMRKKTWHQGSGISSDVPADVSAYVIHSHQHPNQGGYF